MFLRANRRRKKGEPRLLTQMRRLPGSVGLETEWYLEAEYATALFSTERQRHGILAVL